VRASDLVDVASGVLPRPVVKGALVMLVLVMALTGRAGPILWYVHDKAAGLVDVLTPVLQRIVDGAHR